MDLGGLSVPRGGLAVLEAAPEELTAGFRPLPTSVGLSGEIYLTDTLLNGAGYANYFLASDRRFNELLSGVQERLNSDKSHEGPDGNACSGACYACLQDWTNIRLHPLLDWRLAVDLGMLMVSPDTFDPLVWRDHMEVTTSAFVDGIPYLEMTELGDRPAIRDLRDEKLCIITHPFEATHEARRSTSLARAAAQAEARVGDPAFFCSWFLILRSVRKGLALIRFPRECLIRCYLNLSARLWSKILIPVVYRYIWGDGLAQQVVRHPQVPLPGLGKQRTRFWPG